MFNDKLFAGMVENLYMESGAEIDTLPNVVKADAERQELVDMLVNKKIDLEHSVIDNALADIAFNYASSYFYAGFKAGIKFHEWVNK